MKRKYFSVLLLALVLAPLVAADVSGKWTGLAGEAGEVTFDMKADGGKLTGTVMIGVVGPNGSAIREGKVEGDVIEFFIEPEYEGQPTKVLFKGKLSGAEIRFTMSVPSHSWDTEFAAKRPA